MNFPVPKKICVWYFAGYGTHRCSSRQISNGAKLKTHIRRWRVVKGSSQIQATCGTTHIPHGYLAWHSIFGSDPKSIYTAPRKPHWDVAIRVLKYIKGSPGQGLLLPSENNLTLTTYCDSNWGGCQTTRRSVSRCIVFFLVPLLSHGNKKKQTNVSTSSAKAEYRTMANTCLEIAWLRYRLQDLKVSCNLPAQLFCDNQATLHIAANPIFHECTQNTLI